MYLALACLCHCPYSSLINTPVLNTPAELYNALCRVLRAVLCCAHRMGLAGFPNTSAAPQQGQHYAGGLAAGAAGLQQVRGCVQCLIVSSFHVVSSLPRVVVV
jgi:hypothetical protein